MRSKRPTHDHAVVEGTVCTGVCPAMSSADDNGYIVGSDVAKCDRLIVSIRCRCMRCAMDRTRWACRFNWLALAVWMPIAPTPVAVFDGGGIIWGPGTRFAAGVVRRSSIADVKHSEGRGIPDLPWTGRIPGVGNVGRLVSIDARGVAGIGDPMMVACGFGIGWFNGLERVVR